MEEERRKFKSGVLESAEVLVVANVGRKNEGNKRWVESSRVSLKEKKVTHGRMKQNGIERKKIGHIRIRREARLRKRE